MKLSELDRGDWHPMSQGASLVLLGEVAKSGTGVKPHDQAAVQSVALL